ncbi:MULTISPECIES: LysM domain-containing protein [unclassified Halomonas]|uniref:LysM peptidoglycan-binding domain-containing protein n=1 Tax=unclassified Halomonas TaxID=2609666 RepID=UPI00207690D3|nr:MULTISPECIES: LysM domain-containing protein [unclassified Halomonas]
MLMHKTFRLGALAALLVSVAAFANAAQGWERIRSDAPERYVVVKGDTLWGIAARFLQNPWQWPSLWEANPQIRNPHLIYPGDTLVLRDCAGAPCFALETGQPVVKLSPRVRTIEPREAVLALPMDVVEVFLRQHRFLEAGRALGELGYVVGGENQRFISGAGDTLFVRGELPSGVPLGFYRPGEPYLSASGEVLGQELVFIGEARLIDQQGEIARVEALSARQEVRNDDIVIALDNRIEGDFQPRAPQAEVAGHIIAAPGGVRFIGRLQVVAIDLGTQDGLQPGHVLRVDQQGELINDPRTSELFQLPNTEGGLLMVFKPYSRMSYALVMQASNVLAVGDEVRTPRP